MAQYSSRMEEELFRGMVPAEDGKPALGRSAKHLGVRLSIDIAPDANGDVHPETGGMSVSPGSVLNVPNHRRPRAMGYGSTGSNLLRIYAIAACRVDRGELSLRLDPVRPKKHGFVEPRLAMPASDYENALHGTKEDWRQAWPSS